MSLDQLLNAGQSTSSRGVLVYASAVANCDRTMSAASVPETTTLCSSRAVKIAPGHRLHPVGRVCATASRLGFYQPYVVSSVPGT